MRLHIGEVTSPKVVLLRIWGWLILHSGPTEPAKTLQAMVLMAARQRPLQVHFKIPNPHPARFRTPALTPTSAHSGISSILSSGDHPRPPPTTMRTPTSIAIGLQTLCTVAVPPSASDVPNIPASHGRTFPAKSNPTCRAARRPSSISFV